VAWLRTQPAALRPLHRSRPCPPPRPGCSTSRVPLARQNRTSELSPLDQAKLAGSPRDTGDSRLAWGAAQLVSLLVSGLAPGSQSRQQPSPAIYIPPPDRRQQSAMCLGENIVDATTRHKKQPDVLSTHAPLNNRGHFDRLKTGAGVEQSSPPSRNSDSADRSAQPAERAGRPGFKAP